jgi:hypothetical protein
MDLGLLRKLMVTGDVTTIKGVADNVGIMCHNCVKFNGKESDYAILTREYEQYCKDTIEEYANGGGVRSLGPGMGGEEGGEDGCDTDLPPLGGEEIYSEEASGELKRKRSKEK